jgi:adenylate kinase
MHKYIITGVQGCGKGTQAKKLASAFDLVHISVGDIFRWNIKNHTRLGARIKRLVAAGELVSDEVVGEVVRTRLDQHDWNFGFILDGFPRNEAQAEFYLEAYDIDAVILIDVPDRVVMDRILSRRLCSQCGLDYNLIHHRPEVPDQCDVCRGALVVREDDKPQAIQSRLNDYHTKTAPMLKNFARRCAIVKVDGTKPADELYGDLIKKLGLVKGIADWQ